MKQGKNDNEQFEKSKDKKESFDSQEQKDEINDDYLNEDTRNMGNVKYEESKIYSLTALEEDTTQP